MKLIYSPKYEVDIGGHVFPTEKYRLVHDELIRNGVFSETDFVEPVLATEDDLELVHTNGYVRRVIAGTLSPSEIMQLELPYSPALAEVSRLWVGGTVLVGKRALEDGICMHLGGGWHHAFADHGEGFCVFNDHAVSIRRLQADDLIKKAVVVDCDVHQGNGTADIFAGDKDVYTFSIHQEHNYPVNKPPGDLDIGLQDGTGDEVYLEHLRKEIPGIIEEFLPDIVFYVAGADTYQGDQLGGLELTLDGLRKRDELIIGAARKNKVPVAIVLAGGYATRVKDTVEIHAKTAEVASDILAQEK